jgi:predicted DCC family thiol-disulfide oxidoreductase YuxK
LGDRWAPQPIDDVSDGLILFDGVCVFCSRWVRFVLRHDTARRFRFMTIQSEPGRALAARLGIDPDAPETNAVILEGRAWFKSDAALKVLGALPTAQALGLGRVAPKALRDPLYDLIAGNRYRIFGKTDVCMIPDPADRDRFTT